MCQEFGFSVALRSIRGGTPPHALNPAAAAQGVPPPKPKSELLLLLGMVPFQYCFKGDTRGHYIYIYNIIDVRTVHDV